MGLDEMGRQISQSVVIQCIPRPAISGGKICKVVDKEAMRSPPVLEIGVQDRFFPYAYPIAGKEISQRLMKYAKGIVNWIFGWCLGQKPLKGAEEQPDSSGIELQKRLDLTT